jgi:CRISPR/Cas system CSM-associated protein Csm2 small subunit
MDYDFAKKMLHKHTPQKCLFEPLLFNAQFAFLENDSNMTYFKVLAGQYLLQKFTLTLIQREDVEYILFNIASDAELDYDRRADAADVLLQLGSPAMKSNARNIIMQLGHAEGIVRTVFDNAQNVHNEEVEESVAEVLEFFAMMPLKMINKQVIEFEYVKEQVEDMLKKLKENMDEGKFKTQEKKIQVALSRINLDRALYSKYNSTLSNILIKVWIYLTGHEYEEEMRKRLLEELEEMSGTCSSGFASRLINVISGFGEFNIRISWEDQITANFSGRLNAAARKITLNDGIFYNEKLEDVMKLWFNASEQKDLKESIIEKLQTSEYITGNPTLTNVVDYYLDDDIDEKSTIAIEYFAENVLNEMALPSSSTHERLHFSLFFRTYVAYIREEMYQEFKDYLDDTSFDLYMRKAMMHYEGF